MRRVSLRKFVSLSDHFGFTRRPRGKLEFWSNAKHDPDPWASVDYVTDELIGKTIREYVDPVLNVYPIFNLPQRVCGQHNPHHRASFAYSHRLWPGVLLISAFSRNFHLMVYWQPGYVTWSRIYNRIRSVGGGGLCSAVIEFPRYTALRCYCRIQIQSSMRYAKQQVERSSRCWRRWRVRSKERVTLYYIPSPFYICLDVSIV